MFANVARTGGVIGARRARELGGMSRAKGYGARDDNDSDNEDSEGADTYRLIREGSTAWYGDQ